MGIRSQKAFRHATAIETEEQHLTPMPRFEI
jgi:hypothetical protein